MATHVCFGAIAKVPEGMPTFIGSTVSGGESMSETGTAANSAAAMSKDHTYKQWTYAWRVTAIGAAIYAAVGQTAAVSTGVYIPVGATEWIVAEEGEFVSIITA